MNLSRRGSETGSGFQDAVNRTNDAYERAGRACITRKAIPGKYLSDRGESRKGLRLPALSTSESRISSSALKSLVTKSDRRKFIPESKAEPDYGGVIAPYGRAIFYDAKTTRREVLDFDNLHAHQIEFLERAGRAGAAAGFLVEFSLHREVFFLPIQLVTQWRERAERRSIPYKFFVDFLTPAPSGQGFIIFDYLLAIEQQENRYSIDFSRFTFPATRAASRS